MALAIQTQRLMYAFGFAEAQTPVLFGIDLENEQGEVVVLKGASGSGKTTLLTLLACLRALQGGEAHILGYALSAATPALRVHIRRRLGFIFQAHNLHDALTEQQKVRVGLELHGRGPMEGWQALATHLLGLLGLADRTNYKSTKLSGGAKAASCHSPRLDRQS